MEQGAEGWLRVDAVGDQVHRLVIQLGAERVRVQDHQLEHFGEGGVTVSELAGVCVKASITGVCIGIITC
jgi:hypothetical protein